jgi:hypothetical protein
MEPTGIYWITFHQVSFDKLKTLDIGAMKGRQWRTSGVAPGPFTFQNCPGLASSKGNSEVDDENTVAKAQCP